MSQRYQLLVFAETVQFFCEPVVFFAQPTKCNATDQDTQVCVERIDGGVLLDLVEDKLLIFRAGRASPTANSPPLNVRHPPWQASAS